MYLKVNGTRLFFDVVGSGLHPTEEAMEPKPTVIALHGGPGFDHSIFRPQLDPLGEVAQLIYVDLRGQGRSARHRNEYYQVGIMADDIAALCAKLGIEKPVVLGYSFGGFIALSLALRHPEVLGGLILFATAPAFSSGYDLEILEQLVGKELREIADREQQGVATQEERRRYSQEIFPQAWPDGELADLNRLLSRTIMNQDIRRSMEASLKQDYDVRSELASISTPTLVLHGRNDWICSFREAQQMAQAIPHALLHVLERSRHGIHLAEWEEVIQMIASFLR